MLGLFSMKTLINFDLIITSEGSFHYLGDSRKPPVPRRDEYPIMGLKTTKNFITQNAVENIMSVPKKPEKKYVDTRKGDQHLLVPSGLEPRYIQKKVRKDFTMLN